MMDFKPRGIIPPIVTPIKEGKVNHPVLKQLIDHLIQQGVHGVFPLGTTGEFYSFSEKEYREILTTTVDAVDGRVPVYGGANHITTRGVIRQIEICEEVGVDAVSVLTPMFVSVTQDELYDYFADIAASTSLPIIMYNNQPKTGVALYPSTAAKLAKIKNIVGVKDSTGDMTNGAEYLRLTQDNDEFSVLMGRDTLIYAGLCHGSKGSIASCANIAPALAVEIYDKFMEGDYQGALAAQFKLAPLRLSTSLGTFPVVIKEGLAMQGFDVGDCIRPIKPLGEEQRAELQEILKTLELL